MGGADGAALTEHQVIAALVADAAAVGRTVVCFT